MEDNMTIDTVNGNLPFNPTCPKCGGSVLIDAGICGYYAKCENCNSTWSASPFKDLVEKDKWLAQFCGKRDAASDASSSQKDPSNAKILMEIAHASDTLKQAYDLVRQAESLISKDLVSRKYLDFSAKVAWRQFVWDILDKQYAIDNPDDKSTYHLRAFDHYGIQPGMVVGDGMPEGN